MKIEMNAMDSDADKFFRAHARVAGDHIIMTQAMRNFLESLPTARPPVSRYRVLYLFPDGSAVGVLRSDKNQLRTMRSAVDQLALEQHGAVNGRVSVLLQ